MAIIVQIMWAIWSELKSSSESKWSWKLTWQKAMVHVGSSKWQWQWWITVKMLMSIPWNHVKSKHWCKIIPKQRHTAGKSPNVHFTFLVCDFRVCHLNFFLANSVNQQGAKRGREHLTAPLCYLDWWVGCILYIYITAGKNVLWNLTEACGRIIGHLLIFLY